MSSPKQRILSLDVLDVRYPTVRLGMAGSDPRHLAPNYSCAITILRTGSGLEGRSLVFTIGAGTEIQTAAIEALRPLVVGRNLEDFIAEPGLYAQALTEHHQLRWLALGVYRMAVGGVRSETAGAYGHHDAFWRRVRESVRTAAGSRERR